MGKLKNKQDNQDKIRNPDEIELDYPVFSFKYLQTKPANPKDKRDFYAEFIERLKKLCNITWSEIDNFSRHGFGTEKIPIKKIKPAIPAFVTPEVDYLTVFRATGDNRPFLGIRKRNVFYVIFIEESFGDVYDHK
jgi:hypothetical protein